MDSIVPIVALMTVTTSIFPQQKLIRIGVIVAVPILLLGGCLLVDQIRM